MSETSSDIQTIPGLTVGGDLSGSQYRFVKAASTAGEIIAVAASTDIALGVLVDAPDADDKEATVAHGGVVPVEAGTSTITFGEAVGYNSTGQAVDGNALLVGQALEAAGASGDYIKVRLHINLS